MSVSVCMYVCVVCVCVWYMWVSVCVWECMCVCVWLGMRGRHGTA